MSPSVSEVRPGCYLITGDLLYSGLVALRDQAEGLLLQGEGPAVFDLAGVERLNTGALSLLLCLKRKGEQLGRPVRFDAVPEALQAIARLSDMGEFLRGQE